MTHTTYTDFINNPTPETEAAYIESREAFRDAEALRLQAINSRMILAHGVDWFKRAA